MLKRNPIIHSIAILLFLLLGSLVFSRASDFVRLSLEELTSASSHAVRGKFVKTESFWNQQGTAIYTRAVFQVQEALKGDLTKNEIYIYLPGGRVGDKSVIVIGAPEVNIGEEAVLMLQRVETSQREVALAAGEEHFNIVALSQGKFDVRLDSTTNKMMAVSHAVKFFIRPDAKLEDLPPGGAQGLPVEELAGKIREIHQKQLEGERK